MVPSEQGRYRVSWRDRVVTFTGHRPQVFAKYDAERIPWVRDQIREELTRYQREYGIAHAISGMALGVDTWAAEVCIELGIPFVAAVPCDGQAAAWKHEDQVRYHNLLCKAKAVHTISPGPYAAWKMQARNLWMLRRAAHLIAVYDGSPGGTRNMVHAATDRIAAERMDRVPSAKRFTLACIRPDTRKIVRLPSRKVRDLNEAF